MKKAIGILVLGLLISCDSPSSKMTYLKCRTLIKKDTILETYYKYDNKYFYVAESAADVNYLDKWPIKIKDNIIEGKNSRSKIKVDLLSGQLFRFFYQTSKMISAKCVKIYKM